MSKVAINGIAGLAARLTDPADRESYARLISYANDLPPGDEFRQHLEMVGLLALLGQRIPDAIAELVAELRTHAAAAAKQYTQVDLRLAKMPQEIVAGVDPKVIAKEMSESFRQQLMSSGLQDTAALLKAATVTIKTLAAEVASGLKPATQEYAGLVSKISTETTQLMQTARQIQEQNTRFLEQQRNRSLRWVWEGIVAMLLFVLGAQYGLMVEKRHTSDALNHLMLQMERLEFDLSRSMLHR